MKIKQKDNMQYTLMDMKVKFVKEHVFHPTRKWRFDYAILDHKGKPVKIAIEYEGIYTDPEKKNTISRHTTMAGYSADSDKYNAAVVEGWRVLRYTAKNYKNLRLDLMRLLNSPI